MDTLIHKTGRKNIVECLADRLWGTGIPLNDPLCLDSSKWITQGIMGQILESIRDEALQKQQLHHYSTTPIFSMMNNLHHPTVSVLSIAQSTTTTITTTTSQVTVDSNPEHPQFSLPPPGNVLMGSVVDSESTSTTPVSDTTETTTSDTESSKIHTKQPEIQAVPMEETVPT